MENETAAPAAPVEPESFSPLSARAAAEDLFKALPKSRRLDYLGHLNEILVTLERLGVADGRDPNKAV